MAHCLKLSVVPASRLAPATTSAARRGGVAQRVRPASCERRQRSFVVCDATSDVQGAGVASTEPVPLPIVIIQQHPREDATVLELEFGDRLGALLDTTQALKNLGLNVVRAKVRTDETLGRNRFVITRSDTGGKVEDPSMLEAIRMTVLSNLLQYHPESGERLSMSSVKGFPVPRKQLPAVETIVSVENSSDNKSSKLTIQTADRPGLVNEIVDVLTGLSINVLSAEIDTEGQIAKDQFDLSYRGEALNKSMKEVVTNALLYFLTHPEVEEDSY